MADVVFQDVFETLPPALRLHLMSSLMSDPFKVLCNYHIGALKNNLSTLNPGLSSPEEFKNTFLEIQAALRVWQGLLDLSDTAAELYKTQPSE